MGKEYLGYCTNLERRQLKERGIHNSLTPWAYYCGLTGDLCVGDRHTFYELFSHRLKRSSVERCPSRKTIQEVFDEESKPTHLEAVQ